MQRAGQKNVCDSAQATRLQRAARCEALTLQFLYPCFTYRLPTGLEIKPYVLGFSFVRFHIKDHTPASGDLVQTRLQVLYFAAPGGALWPDGRIATQIQSRTLKIHYET